MKIKYICSDWEIEVSRLHHDSLTCILFYPHVFHLITTLGVLELALFVNDRSISAVIDIDSVGTFTMCHEALQYLKKGGPGKSPSTGGIIINISATLHYTATWYQIHVSAAKVCYDYELPCLEFVLKLCWIFLNPLFLPGSCW